MEATNFGKGHSKLKPSAAQKSDVMAEDNGQTSCRVTRPGEDHLLCTLPNMAMWTDIRQYGARPVERQVVTVPGPQPKRGPPAATGKVNQEEKRRQQAKILSSHLEASTVPLVFAQWNTEGLRKKKPEQQEFLKREGVDLSVRSSWKGREWTSSALRKPIWQMLITSPLESTSSSGMAEQTDTRNE